MDMQQLIEEITARVKERLAEESAETLPTGVHAVERRILVVSRKPCGACGGCWEALAPQGGCRMVCVKNSPEERPDADTKAIVALHMTELDILRVAAGAAVDAYTEALVSGLLLGVPVFALMESEPVPSNAPEAAKRYQMLLAEKRRFLETCGVRFTSKEAVLAYWSGEEEKPPERKRTAVCETKRKRLVTESTVRHLACQGETEIVIDQNTIVTDLAKEYANRHQIRLVCRG